MLIARVKEGYKSFQALNIISIVQKEKSREKKLNQKRWETYNRLQIYQEPPENTWNPSITTNQYCTIELNSNNKLYTCIISHF